MQSTATPPGDGQRAPTMDAARVLWLRSLTSPKGRLDLADPSAMALIRSRLLGVTSVLGCGGALLGRASLSPAEMTEAGRPPEVAIAVMGGVGLISLLAGRRVGDRAFMILLVLAQLAVLTMIGSVPAEGHLPPDLLFVAPTVVAAIFCGRRGHVVVQVITATVAASLLTGIMAPAEEVLPRTVGQLFAFTVTAATLRWLRDLAIASVIAARQGEVTDPLTGLGNRRCMERRGVQSWLERAGGGHPVGILIVDIDHFKRVNDTMGHAAGDEVLCRVADLLVATVRSSDVVVRLGGEEFAVLAQIRPGEAPILAERVRAAVETEIGQVTVSVGVTEWLPTSNDSLPGAIWQAVEVADVALYEAKHTGRNRVVSTS